MSGELGFEVRVMASQEQAIETVSEALKNEGFGVLTRIDIDKAFREKIGTRFRPYTILGACNPQLAHTALTSNPEIGLMLPCNVTVEAVTDGESLIRIVNPSVMMQMGDAGSDDSISKVADEAAGRLKRVAAALST